MSTRPTCRIEATHCENCGSTDPADVSNLSDTEGYTRCCNELTAGRYSTCRGQHLR